MNRVVSLGEFIIERQKDFPYATGELSRLISAIRLAAKIVNREVNKAGLVDILGIEGTVNVQGEEQQKLDVYANNQFISALKARGEVCGIGSEENEDFITFREDGSGLLHNGRYIVLIDPLDGSSNIDVNVSIGTIFSIYRKTTEDKNAVIEDFLQSGVNQVAAGYIIYGSSTMLVYTTGHGVNGFTYDPSIGVFCLSHPNMKIPETGPYYSVNEGNFSSFAKGIKKYIEYCKEEDAATSRPLSSRYIGSLVADFHRNLIKGGIYLYPGTKGNPEGKLRLLYECNPLAFLIEEAGGIASDGVNRILSKKPTALHERTPLIIGSTKMVEMAHDYIRKHS